MINISLHSIPHAAQRYETVGDWQGDVPGQITIKVSDMGDWRYEFLVALHELVEGTLCNARGITDAQVSEFDKSLEGDDEPGDDPRAPYRREHFFATNIERLMAAELGVDWIEYECALAVEAV